MRTFIAILPSILLLIGLSSARLSERWEEELFDNNNDAWLLLNVRWDPSHHHYHHHHRPLDNEKDDCHAGALCVGPGHMYPIGRQPEVQIYSTFQVPPLPNNFDTANNTYYDYLNIFWRSQPTGGYMNQFVPQLMLGNALANSTNYPDYEPKWIQLDSWHIGAQYFMGICRDPTTSHCPNDWIAKAATGKLVTVFPGEVIETSFELVPVRNRFEWHLRMGVVGDVARSSIVVADTPFMGLLNNSSNRWMDGLYENVYVGSCLENYGMQGPDNYPQTWQIDVSIRSPTVLPVTAGGGSWWSDWRLEHERSCDWQPQSLVSSRNGSHWQTAIWNATLLAETADYDVSIS
jgi:hypothetical protein